jgi:hypothetical protein
VGRQVLARFNLEEICICVLTKFQIPVAEVAGIFLFAGMSSGDERKEK